MLHFHERRTYGTWHRLGSQGAFSSRAGDSLYGQLWASILGLDTGLSPAQLRSHLAIERAWATTQDGVRLFSNRTTDYDCKVIPGGVPDLQGYLVRQPVAFLDCGLGPNWR